MSDEAESVTVRANLGEASVVFDTNAYREFCGANFAREGWNATSLREREQLKGIVSYANPYVVLELSSHLWDQEDRAFAQCRRGLSVLVEHCHMTGTEGFRLIADAEDLVAKLLYDRNLPGHADTTQLLASFAVLVANAPPGPLDPKIATDSKTLARELDARQAIFVEDMKAVVRKLNPEVESWIPFEATDPRREAALLKVRSPEMTYAIAVGLVLKARRGLGMPAASRSLKTDTDAILEAGGASIALYREILEHVVLGDGNLDNPSRSNSLWDMQVAFAAGQPCGKPPLPLLLVTGDRAIKRAAVAVGLGSSVLRLREYLSKL